MLNGSNYRLVDLSAVPMILSPSMPAIFIRGHWFNTPGLASVQITTNYLSWHIMWVLNQCHYNKFPIDRQIFHRKI
jgi:hypothetical protein